MMVKVIPETEPRTTEPWDGGAPSVDETGAVTYSGDTPVGGEDFAGPLAEGSGDGSGGRLGFGRRERLQRPGGEKNRIDLRNTWQVVAGSILVPLGVVFILIAWYGAAHTPYVQQQMPYLVSGSFAGVACMVLGGLLYWAHWLYRIYDQADHHHDEQLQVMQQTLRALVDRMQSPGGDGWSPSRSPEHTGSGLPAVDVIGSSSPVASPPPQPGPGVRQDTGYTYVVTPGGSVYHDPTCPIVGHHSEGLRVLGSAGVTELEPCRICQPPPPG